MITFKVGDRVRLIEDVAPYPLGLFPAGTTGTVTDVNPDARVGDPIAEVKLDDHFDCLDEWDNVLHVHREEDEAGEVIPDAFDLVE